MADKKDPRDKMKLVSVRMTEAQRRKIERAAKASKESFSAYMRRMAGVEA